MHRKPPAEGSPEDLAVGWGAAEASAMGSEAMEVAASAMNWGAAVAVALAMGSVAAEAVKLVWVAMEVADLVMGLVAAVALAMGSAPAQGRLQLWRSWH